MSASFYNSTSEVFVKGLKEMNMGLLGLQWQVVDMAARMGEMASPGCMWRTLIL